MAKAHSKALRRLRVLGRFVRRQIVPPGSAPGTLIHTGLKRMEKVRVRLIDYDTDHVTERELDDVRDAWPFRDTSTVSWVNVDGLHEPSVVQAVGEHFGIHPLAQEDIVHVGQRAKLEEYDGCLYVVMPMLDWVEDSREVQEEQLSILLGPRWLFTFQERVGDVFEPVRERIRADGSRLRLRGPDYLAYALIDAVVDRYFAILERIAETAEELELAVLEDPSPETMNELHGLKRELLAVRRSIWPMRETTNALMRTESDLVSAPTQVFVRDVYDHAVQIIDTVESLRDVVSGTIDLYLSQMGHRQNEIMKVLTIMASIFIPLTFFAGIYGMNFEHMPELAVPWAYPALLGLMFVIAIGMVIYFWRKGWL